MPIPRIWRRRQRDLELTDDLQSYIDLETEAGIASGLAPDAARRLAQRKLGNITRVREEVHDMYSLTPIEAALMDLRYAGADSPSEPGIPAGRARRSGARHWREHRHLPGVERGPPADAARSQSDGAR